MNFDTPYVIAEIGSNHNGDMNLCRQMIDAAKEVGADAVKFQSFSDKSLISKGEYSRREDYGDSEEDKKRHFGTLKEMVDTYWLRPDQHNEIARYCREIGIEFLSTPFSPQETDMLDDLNAPYFKIASMDVNHLELLKHIASKKKPVILSTGMANLGDIENAVQTLEECGANGITLLHCTSVYPPEIEYLNLRNINSLFNIFELPTGYSDHTIGTDVSLIALSLGATIIEKHFTTDKDLDGWDHWISANPDEMAQIVRYAKMDKAELEDRAKSVENYECILGRKRRIISPTEQHKATFMRRSIVAKTALKAGHILTVDDVDFKRPGDGIRPDELRYLLGRKLLVNVSEDHEFLWEDFGRVTFTSEGKHSQSA